MRLEHLDPWQKEVLEYEGDLLLCTGRRVGKTQIMAIKAAEHLVKNPGSQIIIASLTEDQAKLIIIMILQHLEAFHKKLIGKGKDKPTQNKITLKNKSSALARPVGTTGDALRGFNGDILILDEVSRFNELIMTAATPILLTTGGQIWMASTPFGKRGYFWEMFDQAHNRKEPDARFKVFYKTSEEVIKEREISESWTEKQREKAMLVLEKEKKDKSKLVYGQEYLGLFVEDLARLFPDELIEKVFVLEKEGPMSSNRYSLGVDVGAMGEDPSAFTMFKEAGDNAVQVDYELTEKTFPHETAERIRQLKSIWRFKRGIGLDDGGMGVAVLGLLLRWNIDVTPLNSSRLVRDREDKSKRTLLREDMYHHILSLMEQGRLKMLNDEKMKASFASIQKEIDEDTGKIRIYGNDDHLSDASVRGVWVMTKQKNLNIWAQWR